MRPCRFCPNAATHKSGHAICVECKEVRRLARDKAYRVLNKEKLYATNRAWAKSEKGRASLRAAVKRHDQNPIRKIQKRYISIQREAERLKYATINISKEEFVTWFLAQSNKECPICSKEFISALKEPCVDHDHETGQLRGLICRKCNMVEGFLKDKEYRMAINAYLEKYGK